MLTRKISLSLSFILINLIIISHDQHAYHDNILTFLTNPQLCREILIQLANLGLPLIIIKKLAVFLSMQQAISQLAMYLGVLVLGLFTFAYYKIRSINAEHGRLYLLSLLTIFSLFVFNLYVERVTPSNYIEQDRYFFLPSIFIAVIWVLMFKHLCGKFLNKRIVIYLVLLIYLLYNINLIWTDINANQFRSDFMRTYINYVKSNHSQWEPNTTVFVASGLIWPSAMFQKFYTVGRNIEFKAFDNQFYSDVAKIDPEKVVIIDYETKTHRVFDLTEEYRKNKKVVPTELR